MPTSKSRKKKPPKRVLAPPDLEHAKTAVLNSLTSASGQRTYEHAIREFVNWYCSEPRLAFNRTVVLRYRTDLEQRGYAPASSRTPLEPDHPGADASIRPGRLLASNRTKRTSQPDHRFDSCVTHQPSRTRDA